MAESRSPYLKGASLYVNLYNLYPGRKEKNFVVRTGKGKDRAAGRERGERTGGVRGGGYGRLRLPRDPEHGDPREFRAVRGSLRGVGSQRKGVGGGGARGLDGGSAGPRGDEARGGERRRRPDLHRLLHGGARGVRDRPRRRSPSALAPAGAA